MNNFPSLKTERLRLRALRASDIPRIMSFANNAKVADMTLNIPHPYQEKDAINWISTACEGFEDQSHIIFAIASMKENEFLGGVGLRVNKRFDRAELGFWLGEPFWNRGYVTEAVKRTLQFGFEELDLNKIYATHLPENPASGKVMQKNGMIKEGLLVEHLKKGGHYLDVIQYRLTRREYMEQNSLYG